MLSVQDGYLLAFGERHITARQGNKRERLHPATLAEPAPPDSRRQSCRHAGFLTRQPARDTFPKSLLMLTTPPRRSPRRTQRRMQHPTSRSTLLSCHRNSSHSKCCDHQLNPPSSPASATGNDSPNSAPSPRSDRLATATIVMILVAGVSAFWETFVCCCLGWPDPCYDRLRVLALTCRSPEVTAKRLAGPGGQTGKMQASFAPVAKHYGVVVVVVVVVVVPCPPRWGNRKGVVEKQIHACASWPPRRRPSSQDAGSHAVVR